MDALQSAASLLERARSLLIAHAVAIAPEVGRSSEGMATLQALKSIAKIETDLRKADASRGLMRTITAQAKKSPRKRSRRPGPGNTEGQIARESDNGDCSLLDNRI